LLSGRFFLALFLKGKTPVAEFGAGVPNLLLKEAFMDTLNQYSMNRKNWKKLKRLLWIVFAILKVLKLLKELFGTRAK
jgi:hypothetical protein